MVHPTGEAASAEAETSNYEHGEPSDEVQAKKRQGPKAARLWHAMERPFPPVIRQYRSRPNRSMMVLSSAQAYSGAGG